MAVPGLINKTKQWLSSLRLLSISHTRSGALSIEYPVLPIEYLSLSVLVRTPGIREDKNLFGKDEKCWKRTVSTAAELYTLLNLPLFLSQQERKLSLQNGSYLTAGNLLSRILTHAAGLPRGQELRFCLLTAAAVKENQPWRIREGSVLQLAAVITFDSQGRITSLSRYFLVAKRRANKGCPKQELSWSPSPSLRDPSQSPGASPQLCPCAPPAPWALLGRGWWVLKTTLRAGLEPQASLRTEEPVSHRQALREGALPTLVVRSIAHLNAVCPGSQVLPPHQLQWGVSKLL